MKRTFTSALAVAIVLAGNILSTPAYSQTQDPPTVTNRETGETVQLVRANWNGNRDIAERDIQCSGFVFNFNTGRYQLTDSISNLRHSSLPFVEPNLAFVNFDRPPTSPNDPRNAISPVWRVTDGVYVGPLMAVNIAPGFIELIESSTGQSGIRVWDGVSGGYRDCFDTSGAALRPTGFPEEVLPPVEPDTRSLIVTGSPAPDNPEPLVNLETGEAVQLTEARFDVYEHFWQRELFCSTREFDGTQYVEDRNFSFEAFFIGVNTGPQSGLISYTRSSFFLDNPFGEWRVYDGRIEFTPVGGGVVLTLFDQVEVVVEQVEVLDETVRTVRSWLSSERFVQCFGLTPLDSMVDLTPNPDVPPTNNTLPICVSAITDPDGDGFGFENNQSCIVNGTSTGAGGTTGNTTFPVCASAATDPDGDGFGFENNRSCIVEGTSTGAGGTTDNSTFPVCASAATDPDGDGFGFENNLSCIVEGASTGVGGATGNITFPVCASAATDPDGDGFGFENNRSCIVEGTSTGVGGITGNTTFPVCASAVTDPDGDGFGFENNRSCIIEGISTGVGGTTGNTTFPVCASAATDPDGDGFGFENNRSCIVEASI